MLFILIHACSLSTYLLDDLVSISHYSSGQLDVAVHMDGAYFVEFIELLMLYFCMSPFIKSSCKKKPDEGRLNLHGVKPSHPFCLSVLQVQSV